jgi:phosphate transport system permease protein
VSLQHESRAIAVSLAPSAHLRRRFLYQKSVIGLMIIATSLTIIITVGIVLSLLPTTIELLSEITTQIFGTIWAPLFDPPEFGVLPLLTGTLTIVSIAMLIGVPLGLASAIFLSDYATFNVRRIVKPILEILAGVPTVVLGLFGLYILNPELIERFWPIGEPGAYTALGAGIMTGILIIPIIASVADDSLSSVPRAMREAAYALGATRREVAVKVVFKAGLSGVVAALVLAFARAFGETTIALMVAGSYPLLSANPGDPMQTLSAFIGFAAIGDAEPDGFAYKSIFMVGTFLFLVTLVLNIIGNRFIARFREAYE